MKFNQAPKQKSHENLGRELADAAAARPDTSYGKLGNRANRLSLIDTVGREPLVSEEHYGGKLQEGLTHILVIGETVLGISRDFNRSQGNGLGDGLDSVRVSVLPFGPAAQQNQVSRTLFEVRMATLRNPRSDGVRQEWEAFDIGRQNLANVTGVEDPMVSRQHLRLTVSLGGNIEITDEQSSNGTQVLTMHDFGMHGLTEDGQQMLGDTLQEMQDKPYMWDKQYADTTARIIDAQ